MTRKPKDFLTDGLTLLLFLLSAGTATVNAFSKPPYTAFTWLSLTLAVTSGIVGLLIYFRKGRLEKSYQLGLEEGANAFLQQWAEVAALHEAGMDNAYRQLQDGMQFNPHERVSTDALASYLKAITATFKIFYPAQSVEFTASLAVINRDRTCSFLVMIEPGGKGRSNPLPRPYPLTDNNWGMVETFNTGQMVYTTDVRLHGNAGNRNYLSVVNMPVKDVAGKVIAVVNVDSPVEDAFVSKERVEQAHLYCLPILSSVSLSLADPRPFGGERN